MNFRVPMPLFTFIYRYEGNQSRAPRTKLGGTSKPPNFDSEFALRNAVAYQLERKRPDALTKIEHVISNPKTSG
jgi:hypothetical protein